MSLLISTQELNIPLFFSSSFKKHVFVKLPVSGMVETSRRAGRKQREGYKPDLTWQLQSSAWETECRVCVAESLRASVNAAGIPLEP